MYAYQSTYYPVPLNISKIIYAFSNKFHSHQTGILRIVRDRDSTSVFLGQIFEIPIKIGSTYHVQLTFRMKSFKLSLSLSLRSLNIWLSDDPASFHRWSMHSRDPVPVGRLKGSTSVPDKRHAI